MSDEQRPPGRQARPQTRPRWGRPHAVAGVGLAVVAAVVVLGVALPRNPTAEVSLGVMEQQLADGDVTRLVLDERNGIAEVELSGGILERTAYPTGYAEGLARRALRSGAEVEVVRPAMSAGDGFFAALPVLLALGLVLFLFRGRLGMGATFGGTRGRQSEVPDTRFADVAGATEATSELQEVVEYLKDPDRYAHLQARAPKGVLLVGAPGTGKTLLARAVAGEAGVPFFALSGSDFVEKFVGVGASRVRKVFDLARKAERAIVFIDEIDAVGKRRGASLNSNEERENTLNQLLVEMDGFAASEIVVLAATNRPDTLDPALTRPGRFDRQITVAAPDRAGREAILRLYLADRPAQAVDLEAVSRRTPGFTGADLANLVNQAALAAAREDAAEITMAHVEDAIATVMIGRERRSAEVLQRDREITAWHEAGHTVAALVQADAADPAGVSIIPRGHAGGVTWMNGDDHQFFLAPQAHAQLAVAMAGRAAEELVYGAAYSQGASGDLRSATDLATRMAADYGMSPVVGPVHIPEEQRHTGESADLLQRAVRQLLTEALERARVLLADHRDLLDAIAAELLDRETLDAGDLAQIRGRADAA
jgi:cell division protease FtsH